ncbi:MAG: hypothetical protein BWZ03_00002 [bacterium ADurb.BinA186]|nr:MAG: hypothetical protein BWZ03_00002 [bacterium ADurb.BinA186]
MPKKQVRTISVFSDHSLYTLRWISALYLARKEFRQASVKIKFEDGFCFGLTRKFSMDGLMKHIRNQKYDIVFCSFSMLQFYSKVPDDEIFNFLKAIRPNAKTIVWLDNVDSSGTCQFQFMPYVDLYLKKQLYKDRSLYSKKLYRDIEFADYLHNVLGVPDVPPNRPYCLLNPKDSNKLELSWNAAYAYQKTSRHKALEIFFFIRYLLFKHYRATYPPTDSRPFVTTYRGKEYPKTLFDYQRAKTTEILAEESKKRTDIPDLSTNIHGEEYMKEIRQSKSVTSPFGYGEISFRDYDAMANGAVLIKPSMETLVTFPDLYRANETYVPIKWDLSDYKSVIDRVSKYDEPMRQIAENGYHAIRRVYSRQGRLDLVKHLCDVLKI